MIASPSEVITCTYMWDDYYHHLGTIETEDDE